MLTREQILAEPAGKQLNHWIAEHVLRWVPDGKGGFLAPMDAMGSDPNDPTPLRMPDFSTDIAAAWKVVEALKVKPREGLVELRLVRSAGGNPEYAYECTVLTQIYGADEWAKPDEYTHHANATTMPLAICRAALLAVSRPAPATRPESG